MIQKAILVVFFCSHLVANGQTSVIINSDGTHSLAISHGSTALIVNSDGTHSVGIISGNIITAVHPNGTHSTGFINGVITTFVNSNGTHSVGRIRKGEHDQHPAAACDPKKETYNYWHPSLKRTIIRYKMRQAKVPPKARGLIR